MWKKRQHLDIFEPPLYFITSIRNICARPAVSLQRKASKGLDFATVACWLCVSGERGGSGIKQGFVQILPPKNPSSLHILPVPLGKALCGVPASPPPCPDFKRLYLRGWHSSPRLCHTPARPGGLHMHTLSNHPSVTWVTSRSCCSAGGLCIGSDWWKGRKQKERKQRNTVHVHVGNEFMCTDQTTRVWEEWWGGGVCICSLVTSFFTPLQLSLFSASGDWTSSTTRDDGCVWFVERFGWRVKQKSFKAKRFGGGRESVMRTDKVRPAVSVDCFFCF